MPNVDHVHESSTSSLLDDDVTTHESIHHVHESIIIR